MTITRNGGDRDGTDTTGRLHVDVVDGVGDIPTDDPAVDLETRAVHTLRPHPRNSAIYGDGADSDLVASVRQWGVLMPLLVTPDGLVISGHRRLDAARKAGRAEVPVLIHAARDDVEVLALLLEANRQRHKTNEQIGREYAAAKEVEAAVAEQRRLANLPQNRSVPSSAEVLTSTPRRETTHGKARDRAAERVGVGWQKAERAAAVVQAMDYLQDRGKAREAAELRQTLNGTSVQRAYEQAVDAGYVERPALRAASRLSRRCHTTIDEQRMQNATIDALLPRLRWAELEQLLFFAVEEGLSVKSLWRLCRERQQARQDEANRQDIGTDGVDAGAAQSGRSRDNKEGA